MEKPKAYMEMHIPATQYSDARETYTDDKDEIYKYIADVYMGKARGSKDVKRIRYIEKYDGMRHIEMTISNGVKVEICIDR